MVKLQCRTCQFYRPTISNALVPLPHGTCHLEPPQILFVQDDWHFPHPVVESDNVCSHHKGSEV